MTRIALLSHRGGNIGHDFMAIGMEQALTQAFGDDVRIDHFEQHRHFEVYPEGHWLRWIDRIPHGRLKFVRRYLNRPQVRERLWKETLPLEYALAVTSGGPNIVPGGSRSVELGLMLHHLNGAFTYRGVPLIDGGVGASFPLEHVPERMQNESDRAFYRTAFALNRVTALRDVTAHQIAAELGYPGELIPCAAIGTGRVFEQWRPDDGSAGSQILINFQRYGANTDWGQGVDANAWMQTMRAAIADLEQRHTVVLLAQDAFERRLAATLAPQLRVESPTTAREYAQVIGRAKAAIVSRIHAAIPLAGIGVPSAVIGTDTRLGTVEQYGLPTSYVKQATVPWLVDTVERLAANAGAERERLIALRESTLARYASLFREHARADRL